jgi:hypothetical protein
LAEITPVSAICLLNCSEVIAPDLNCPARFVALAICSAWLGVTTLFGVPENNCPPDSNVPDEPPPELPPPPLRLPPPPERGVGFGGVGIGGVGLNGLGFCHGGFTGFGVGLTGPDCPVFNPPVVDGIQNIIP